MQCLAYGRLPQPIAKSGIALYTPPPHTLEEGVLDPIHTAVYITFMLSTFALFSETWIEISDSGPQDFAKQLTDRQMVCLGLALFFRRK